MSTIVEPPRSPKAADPASIDVGNGPSTGVVDEAGRANTAGGGAALGNGVTNGSSGGMEGERPVDVPHSQPSEPAPTLIMSSEQPTLPPLPVNAPLPPTPPEPKDEVLPTPPADLLPPAVPTPSVITVEDPLADAGAPITPPPDIIPGSFPTPSGAQFDPIEPPSSSLPQPSQQEPDASAPSIVEPSSSSEAMDVDEAIGMSAGSSSASLKRAAEGDLGERDEKRIKEDVTDSAAPPPSQPVINLPQIPGQPAVVPPWQTYPGPPSRNPGPSTPLTAGQHKHLLNTIRSLKKAKDAPVFHAPVDVVAFGIPHYAQIITKPMDLTTVESKLVVSDPRGPPKDKSKLAKWDESKGKYATAGEVIDDVRQIWENTRKFNGYTHFVSQIANRLDDLFEKAVNNMPAEVSQAWSCSIMLIHDQPAPYTPAPYIPPPAAIPASPAAGPSSARRASISQPPIIRRTSDGTDSRPKREIHPPPSKDLAYNDGGPRKPKRRNDPQIQWVSKTIKGFETSPRHFDLISPFLYPVENLVNALEEYRIKISHPIDLLQIKAKIADGAYDDVYQVDADIRLMIANALKFNPEGHVVHVSTQQLLQLWNEKWRMLPAKAESRDSSIDPLAGDFMDGDESDDDESELVPCERQDMLTDHSPRYTSADLCITTTSRSSTRT
jgi:bromodomain-containing factor 1